MRTFGLYDRLELGALAPYWERLQDWWTERSPRERLLLGSLAALGILALLLAILAPLRDAREEARADIRSANLLEAWLRSGADLSRLGGFSDGTASAIVADTAAAAQLQLAQTAQSGSDVSVTVQDANFDAVMTWIADMEATSNLRLKSALMIGEGAPGMVNATLVFGE